MISEIRQKDNSILLCIALHLGLGEMNAECPNCNAILSTSEWILDDCYGCAFQCPKCEAIMFLQPTKGLMRGYTKGKMFLSLPDEKEKEMNNLPDGAPLRKVVIGRL